MNAKITLLLFSLIAGVALVSAGLLGGQTRNQGDALTLFFTGDTEGEVAPCG